MILLHFIDRRVLVSYLGLTQRAKEALARQEKEAKEAEGKGMNGVEAAPAPSTPEVSAS